MKMTARFTKCGLTGLIAMLLSCSSLAQQEQRLHLKCHLQTADQQLLITQFVIHDGNKQKFINSLTGQVVFMADGRTQQEITAVYECVDLKARFKSKQAVELDEQTPR